LISLALSPSSTGTLAQPIAEETQPSHPTSWTSVSPTTDTSTVLSPITRNPDVPQFPLNPEKWLNYTSSRGWYALHFPSANISYAASAVQENFGSANLLCSYVINVIQYADKDNLEISPSLRIYECQVKGTLPVLWEQYLITESTEKTFVLQINDSAWIDFANAVEFSAL
jgi:hypothetical protein